MTSKASPTFLKRVCKLGKSELETDQLVNLPGPAVMRRVQVCLVPLSLPSGPKVYAAVAAEERTCPDCSLFRHGEFKGF